ncbi:MAG: 3-deoxy-7-phosphoheptulonate synthase [Gammaproteobacteria bacterium]|nr:3-deoxy-7-phosphoheptulonate synthase [Gammaproteobacteria bacterium]
MRIEDQHILSKTLLPPPEEVKQKLPLEADLAQHILNSRWVIQNILKKRDHRLFWVIGPCSIHDLKAAREYASRLRDLAKQVEDTFFIVMRVYFEKPRTTMGWKGFINDPFLNDTFQIEQGLYQARQFLLDLASLGLPAGTEALDPVVPQYLQDCMTWTAIGARTAESQTHREMASGLSTPIGFKNGTDGNLDMAVNAMAAASRSHHFLGITQGGQCAVFHTAGNSWGHLILRGGVKPNYDPVSVALTEALLKTEHLPLNIVIDCSHGNSLKKPELQPLVLENGVHQILGGNTSIVGFMLESHLYGGAQSLKGNRSELRYGVSITDACLDWETTETIVLAARDKLKDHLPHRY